MHLLRMVLPWGRLVTGPEEGRLPTGPTARATTSVLFPNRRWEVLRGSILEVARSLALSEASKILFRADDRLDDHTLDVPANVVERDEVRRIDHRESHGVVDEGKLEFGKV